MAVGDCERQMCCFAPLPETPLVPRAAPPTQSGLAGTTARHSHQPRNVLITITVLDMEIRLNNMYESLFRECVSGLD